MRKLHLDPESLAVESFETAKAGAEPGTVRGNELTTAPCPQPTQLLTCARKQTLYNSCFVECECTNQRFACIQPQTD
ncbi:MAG TPA: hypothetical protein VFQ39_04620 [Longimicrobium sp.]|nr:hypothetical protein [Longimicrobium sp.]